MTRPKLVLGVLAAACVGTLLWYAWLILAADLPRGAAIATWVLWLFSTAAVVTLWAYVREFLAHRQAVGRDASWKPLPSLVLLWIGGLTAMVSFAFVLPDKAPADGADDPATTNPSLTSQRADATTNSVAVGARSATTTSRSSSPRTPAPVSTAASTDASPTTTGASSPTSTDASTSSTATKSKSTKNHPGTGSPTRSTTSTGGPLVSITLPPPPG